MYRDEAGQVVGVFAAARDITERKRAEEKFRLAVESAPNAMVMIDRTGRIVLVNAQTEKVFGYGRGELLGQSVELLVPEQFQARTRITAPASSPTPRRGPWGWGAT